MNIKFSPIIIAYTLRIFYLTIIIVCIATGKPQHALMFSVPFLLTLPLVFMARKEDRYYTVDACFMCLFTVSSLFSYFNLWPATQSLFTIDKLFHLVAGACLAGFARIFFKKRISDRSTFYMVLIMFALVVGAGWEFFEWALSKLPAPYMIPSMGLDDTMIDLIADTLGAAAVAVYHAMQTKRVRENTWVEIK